MNNTKMGDHLGIFFSVLLILLNSLISLRELYKTSIVTSSDNEYTDFLKQKQILSFCADVSIVWGTKNMKESQTEGGSGT